MAYGSDMSFPFYTDVDGSPLEGAIWIGVAGQNPVTNPVAVYWDSAATQPAAQPVTISKGRTVRSDGTPSRVWVASDFSALVQNKLGAQVLFESTQPVTIGALNAINQAIAQVALATTQAGIATSQAAAASASAAAAQTAQAQAWDTRRLYPDTATALADGTLAVGQYFGVLSATSSEVALVYLKAAGPVATDTGKRIPSTGLLTYPRPVTETIGTGISGSTGQEANTIIQTWPTASTQDGFVETISFQAPGAGYVRLYVYELLSGSQYTITRILDFKVAAGLNTFSAPNDFDYFRLPPGSRIGGKVTSGGTNILDQLSPTASNSSRNFLASESTVVGAVANLQALNGSTDIRIPSMKYTIVHPNTILAYNKTKLNEFAAGVLPNKTDVAAARRGRKTIQRTFFPGTSTPSNWALNGWTVNNGLIAPAAPGTGTHARYDSYVNANYATYTARFLVTDATTSRFGIFTLPSQASWGGAWQVDAATSKLTAYTWDGASAFTSLDPTFAKSVAIPALVSGREYLMTVRTRGMEVDIEWRDCKTGVVTTFTSLFTASTHDNCRGKPGVIYTAGAANGVTCKMFDIQPLFEAPKIVLVGDSNTWGGSIGPSSSTLKPLEWKSAWAYLLDAQRGRGDVLNACRGGELSTTWAASNMQDANITPWSPDYWVIALGTNDVSQATWRTNMASVIAACNARGGQVVLATIPPKSSGQALVDSMNTDILANFFGAYPIIDFAFALSISNDRSSQNTALFNADGIHANVDGHAAMFTQLKADAPYLLQA